MTMREKFATEWDITDIEVMSTGRYIEVMSTGINYNYRGGKYI